MKFEKYRISDEIKSNLIDMGFHRTTDIQFKAIPPIMNGEDVLAIAQTGTGKTAAFAIPTVNAIQEKKLNGKTRNISCLVLAPTRELSKQIGQVFAKICKRTGVVSFAVYGGVEQDKQIEQLTGGVDVLVATPGRMFDLISQGHIDVSKVRTLILDEADHMLDLGFIGDIKSVKTKLSNHHQTLFFSATINPKIKKLAYSQINSNAMRIQVSPEKMISKNISHFKTKIEMDEKRHFLTHFLNHCFEEAPDSKTIVFVRTQVRAERVLRHLQKNDLLAVNIHGGMEQVEREKNLDSFRQGKSKVLIATDVSARGIDLPGITHVVNYDLPDDPENYVHRIGRTGRGFAKGDALSFCAPEEKEKLADIENFLQSQIQELKSVDEYKKETSVVNVETLEVSEILALEEELAATKKNKSTKSKKRKK